MDTGTDYFGELFEGRKSEARDSIALQLHRMKHMGECRAAGQDRDEGAMRLYAFDLEHVDLLMQESAQQGERLGYDRATDHYEAQLEQVRRALVQDVTTQFLTWLLPLHARLEDALVAPVDVEADPDRPADEWVDDRAERLQQVLDSFRRELPGLAEVADQSALVPERFEGDVALWRVVHPSDAQPVADKPVTLAELEGEALGTGGEDKA